MKGELDGQVVIITGASSGIGAATNGADDVGFIRALLDKLEHNFRIDAHRIYCCGFSAGAIMSYSLGAGLSDRLAAIGVASASIGAKQPNGSVRTISLPSNALPIIVFHGKQDNDHFNAGPCLGLLCPAPKRVMEMPTGK